MLFLIRNTVKDTSTEAVTVQESLWNSNLTRPLLLQLRPKNSLWLLVVLTVTAASPPQLNTPIRLQTLYLTIESRVRYIHQRLTCNPRILLNRETTTALLSLDTYPLIHCSTLTRQRAYLDQRTWILAAAMISNMAITVTALGLKS